MALVERANLSQVPLASHEDLLESLTSWLRRYHDARLGGRTAASALPDELPGLQGGDVMARFGRIACAEYERGRGAPGRS
jgi:hypothetical protein